MPAWPYVIGGAAAASGEWFSARFDDAKAAIPGAGFDTIIREEFDQTVTAELADVVGVSDANPDTTQSAGVVTVATGDAVVTPSSSRLQATLPSTHVKLLDGVSWYAAALCKILRPTGDDQMGNTACDAIGLWSDDNNHVGLGILGDASGGSLTNWIGYSDDDASISTVVGPALDGDESPVWHLFEMWFDVDAAKLHFRIDGTLFANTIGVAAIPAVSAWWAMISRRDDVGDQVVALYDKACVVVKAPTVGQL